MTDYPLPFGERHDRLCREMDALQAGAPFGDSSSDERVQELLAEIVAIEAKARQGGK